MTSSKIIPFLYKRPVYEDALDVHAKILEERAIGHVEQLRRSHIPRPKKKKEIPFMNIMNKNYQTTDSK